MLRAIITDWGKTTPSIYWCNCFYKSPSCLYWDQKNFFLCFFTYNTYVSHNFTKWSNTLKQFVGKFPTNCLSVFDHFVGLALQGLSFWQDLFLFLVTSQLNLCFDKDILIFVHNYPMSWKCFKNIQMCFHILFSNILH